MLESASRGGVFSQGVWSWGGGVCSWGVAAPGGVGGCLLRGEVLLLGGGAVSQHVLRQTPPVNRMTNRCKNITLATTSLRLVMILKQSVLDKTRTPASDQKPLRMCVKGDYLYEGIKLHWRLTKVNLRSNVSKAIHEWTGKDVSLSSQISQILDKK